MYRNPSGMGTTSVAFLLFLVDVCRTFPLTQHTQSLVRTDAPCVVVGPDVHSCTWASELQVGRPTLQFLCLLYTDCTDYGVLERRSGVTSHCLQGARSVALCLC